jgi:hypothetical protein
MIHITTLNFKKNIFINFIITKSKIILHKKKYIKREQLKTERTDKREQLKIVVIDFRDRFGMN